MKAGIIGIKKGMTQRFDAEGNFIPVTIIEAGPCVVTAKRTAEKDGYNAVQLGFGDVKEKRISKGQLGHLAKNSIAPKKYIKEFRNLQVEGEVGATVDLNTFAEITTVKVSGVSKGKGFQGVIRRHGFAGGPMTHGSRFHRAPGSIGACADPSKVFKGQKMPGHMGARRSTAVGLKVHEVDAANNLLFIKGAIPGPTDSLVYVVAQ